MLRKNIHTLFLFLILSCNSIAQAQESNPLHGAGNPGTLLLTATDSIINSGLPVLKFEAHHFKNDLPELPAMLNNAELPYFRPIFSQGSFASCGQASGVAYNFTYEINRARNLPADVPENQYPTHYHWNFTNGGYGWFGSSYFHSFEILRTNGSPTVADYGGIDYGGGTRWMSGYDKYYNGMHHRIEGVYRIDVSTPEGLETLKHWLHNHLDGSETGGVASFYANASNYTFLPPGTPKAGKPVIPNFMGPPSHAWVIVGYNDSIRFDVNGDGQFTNHLDINGDGVVDMRDWEIGGVWVANSWGDNWGDEGFSFVLYRTLAESVFSGGIWDNSVHVIKVKEEYSPILTARISLRHTSRGMIKVQMGVAEDASLQLPQHIIDFPIFNFQGGNRFMQGGTEEEHKTIEFGLDITPLLDHIEPGREAGLFLQVIENDPRNLHQGEILAFSVIDHTGNEPVEYAYPGSDIGLINNSVTTLGVTANINFDKVVIDTEELPVMAANQQTEIQLQASGGLEPYRWDLLFQYSEHAAQYSGPASLPEKSDTYPGWNQWQSTELDFDFPLFDTAYNQITAFVNGFIMFEEKTYPYPYWLEPMILFRNNKSIAPFLARNLTLKEELGDQIWFEPAHDHIRINWKLTYEYGNYQLPVSFSAVLYDDGKTEFHYDAFWFQDHCIWLAGLSKGDGINYFTSSLSGKQEIASNTATAFSPARMPANLELSRDGLLTYENNEPGKIFDILAHTTDSRSITDRKALQLSDRFIFEFEPVEETLVAGRDVAMEVKIKNISTESQQGINICFDAQDDATISWLNPCFDIFDLAPGETKTLHKTAMFRISEFAPDNYMIGITGEINQNGHTRNLFRRFNARKSMLGFTSIVLEGSVQNNVVPGQTYDLHVGLANYGDASAANVKLEVFSDNPFIILPPPVIHEIGDLMPLSGDEIIAAIKIHPGAIPGHECEIRLRILGENIPAYESVFQMVIGKTRIVAVDLDPNNSSVSHLTSWFKHKGLANNVVNKIGPGISGHDIAFICLGSFPQRHIIAEAESKQLEDFLENGGNIYMEGSATWRTDPRQAVHDMFGIQGSHMGWIKGIDSLSGNPDSFAANHHFKYQGENTRMDNMETMHNDAFILFTDVPTGLHFAIASETNTFKTIGSTFKFNGLYQHLNDTLPGNLLYDYLDFFGMQTESLIANFTSNKHSICDGEFVEFELKSSAVPESVYWIFEGGTPESSTQLNPIVQYDVPGKWPVKLVVNKRNDSDTLLIEEYITVESCAGIPEKSITGGFRIFPNPAGSRISLLAENNYPLQSVVVTITDLSGRICFTSEERDFGHGHHMEFDISSLKSGVYIVSIMGQSKFSSNKLLINR